MGTGLGWGEYSAMEVTPRAREAGSGLAWRPGLLPLPPVVTVFFFLISLFFSSFSPAPGFDENIESQGELILQESFQVWDPKTLIRKGRERHLFLFEMSLVFSKEVKDSSGRSKYLYKSKLFVSMGPRGGGVAGWWGQANTAAVGAIFIARINKNISVAPSWLSILQAVLPVCPRGPTRGSRELECPCTG